MKVHTPKPPVDPFEFLHGTNELPTHGEATQEAEVVDRLLGEACDAFIPKGIYIRGKKQAYWWSGKVAVLRAECLIAKRRYKRSRSRETDRQDNKELFKECRKKLKIATKKRKEACWVQLCAQVKAVPWGL